MSYQGGFHLMSEVDTQSNTLVERNKLIIAYILWFFFGQLVAHRFYGRKFNTAIWQVGLGLTGWVTSPIFIGYGLLFILWIWLIIDLFLIPKMCRELSSSTT